MKSLDNFGLDKHLPLNEWNSLCSSLAAAGSSTHHGILSVHAGVATIRILYCKSDKNQKIWKALVSLCISCSKWIHTCISQQKVHQNLPLEKKRPFHSTNQSNLQSFVQTNFENGHCFSNHERKLWHDDHNAKSIKTMTELFCIYIFYKVFLGGRGDL